MVNNAFFHERGGGTGLYAGATGDTFGIEKILADAGGYFRVKAAAFDGQRKRALNFVARAHAT